jgi:hypothetical protein
VKLKRSVVINKIIWVKNYFLKTTLQKNAVSPMLQMYNEFIILLSNIKKIQFSILFILSIDSCIISNFTQVCKILGRFQR